MKIFTSRILLLAVITGACTLSAQWKHAEGNLPAFALIDALDASDSMTAMVAPRFENTGNWPMARTIDGGASWTLLPIPVQYGATDVAIADANHLWFVSSYGHIYGSSDGGRTWNLQFFDTLKTKFIDYIEMFNVNEGVAVGENDPVLNKPVVILHTSNGGAAWTPVLATGFVGEWSGDNWRRIDFVNKNVGYFYASKSGLPYKTTDGGATWTSIPFPLKKTATVIKFGTESIGLAAVFADTSGVPRIYRTINGGTSWQLVKVVEGQKYSPPKPLLGS